MNQLPSNPRGIRILSDPEAQALREQDPSLPTHPRHCQTCDGTGKFKWYDDDGTVDDYECNCIDQYVAHLYLRWSGVDLRYAKLRWSDFENQTQLAPVREYLAKSDYLRSGIGLTLLGPSNTGKTMVAVLVFKELLGRGVEGYFTSERDMLDLFKSSWRADGDRKEFHRRVLNVPLLGIDNLEPKRSDHSRDFAVETIERVISGRAANEKPTIIAMQVMPDEAGLRQVLENNSIVISFTGQSFAQTQGQRKINEARSGLRRPITFL